MSSRSSARICITFKAGQRSALDRISRASGAPLSELVRRAVDSFVAARAAGHDRALDQLEANPGASAASSPPLSPTLP
jgi:hypothetical protein